MPINNRLIHDAALVMAVSILEVFRPVLRDDEVRDAFAEIKERVELGTLALLQEFAHEQWRMHPYSRN